MNKLIIFLLLAASASVQAASSEGVIKEYYATSGGSIALTLEEGFSNEAIDECQSNNGYAGASPDADPILKSILLSAAIAKKNVRLVINGCEGQWLKITAAFVIN